MRTYNKKDFPVERVREYLEPGPIVLVSSQWRGETDIMTMGWYTVMEFSPSLIGCIIVAGNHSFDLIRKSKECVINLPEAHLAEKVVRIGNITGAETDKFSRFTLTKGKAGKVKAPLIRECYANLECRLYDGKLIDSYNFFIFEVVKARVARSPRNPKTIHYRGQGSFMISGPPKSYRKYFRPENL